MATSSANVFIGEDTVDGKSLIYRMKIRGPKIEPCGTPHWTGDYSDELPLIHLTYERLVFR